MFFNSVGGIWFCLITVEVRFDFCFLTVYTVGSFVFNTLGGI